MASIKPSQIYFTNPKIKNRFNGCCKLLTETLDEIIQGKTLISSIPKIKVFYVEYNGFIKYFSKNNRRLWVFKILEKMGIIDFIDVKLEKIDNNTSINSVSVMEAMLVKSI